MRRLRRTVGFILIGIGEVVGGLTYKPHAGELPNSAHETPRP